MLEIPTTYCKRIVCGDSSIHRSGRSLARWMHLHTVKRECVESRFSVSALVSTRAERSWECNESGNSTILYLCRRYPRGP